MSTVVAAEPMDTVPLPVYGPIAHDAFRVEPLFLNCLAPTMIWVLVVAVSAVNRATDDAFWIWKAVAVSDPFTSTPLVPDWMFVAPVLMFAPSVTVELVVSMLRRLLPEAFCTEKAEAESVLLRLVIAPVPPTVKTFVLALLTKLAIFCPTAPCITAATVALLACMLKLALVCWVVLLFMKLLVPPELVQLASELKQMVSVVPPAMLGNCTSALPVPDGFRPWMVTSLLLLVLARFRLPSVEPATPTVRLPLVMLVGAPRVMLLPLSRDMAPAVLLPMLTAPDDVPVLMLVLKLELTFRLAIPPEALSPPVPWSRPVPALTPTAVRAPALSSEATVLPALLTKLAMF